MNGSIEPQHTQRFVLKERLGSGGMGVVYSAYDRTREEKVALKILHTSDASALYRFKKEFRTLADVAHPNLVNLYELIAEDEQWFFTMEIVDGRSFFEYVRPLEATGEIEVADESLLGDPPFPWDTEGALMGGELDPGRLRAALRQQVAGVQALHDSGTLHRDLKPSNVMVTEHGRLVILDFGLATELAPESQTPDSGLAGTVAYMAPEQAKSEGATAASDWYAVGVILFQALTGRLPFTGSLYDVLIGKQEKAAPSPAEGTPGLPPDLTDLCEQLLALDPAERPTGPEILKLLGEEPADLTTSKIALVQEKLLVGRQAPLAKLKDAFGHTTHGQAVAVYTHGPSGMGKTSLIDYFLESLTRRGDATVLRGRCYEREMVPYKALDGVVDSLSRYLAALDESEITGLLPRDVHALLRLFPVLRRPYAMSKAPRGRRDSPDLLTLRRRAFEALRELLGRIAARRPLVLFIDDLQWADADSTALLEDLLRPPDPPPLLVLASFRSEEIEQKAFLRDLLEATGTDSCRQVTVTALTEAQVRELATALLEGEDFSEPVLEAIVKEAQGSPFLVEQLARFIQVNRDALRTGLTLVEMLEERMRQLPAGARPVLLTMAATNRPLDAAVAYQAAGETGDERSLVASLRAAHFVRSSGSAQRLELYHDRIRDALFTLLDARDLQQHAMALARQVDSPHAIGLATMQIGLIAYFNGHWREAAKALDEAAALFNDRCSGVVWEVTMCRRFSLGSLMYLREIAELQRRVPVHLAEAKERGNIFLADTARARLNIVWLAADDPEAGRRVLNEGQTGKPWRGFTVSRYNQLLARVQADLYCGDAPAARRRLKKDWPELEKSLLLRVHLVRVEALQARARAALAIASEGDGGGGEIKPLLRLASRAAAKIGADRRPWALPLAELLRAGGASVRGDRTASLAALNAAAEGFEAAEMALYAAVAHRRLGEVMANEDGRQLIAAADTWMKTQRIENPVRMTAMMAPGFASA